MGFRSGQGRRWEVQSEEAGLQFACEGSRGWFKFFIVMAHLIWFPLLFVVWVFMLFVYFVSKAPNTKVGKTTSRLRVNAEGYTSASEFYTYFAEFSPNFHPPLSIVTWQEATEPLLYIISQIFGGIFQFLFTVDWNPSLNTSPSRSSFEINRKLLFPEDPCGLD